MDWVMKTLRKVFQQSTHREHWCVRFAHHSCQALNVVLGNTAASMDCAIIYNIPHGEQQTRLSNVSLDLSIRTVLVRRVYRWQDVNCRLLVSYHAPSTLTRDIMIMLELLWSSHGVNLWITTWHWLVLHWVSSIYDEVFNYFNLPLTELHFRVRARVRMEWNVFFFLSESVSIMMGVWKVLQFIFHKKNT